MQSCGHWWVKTARKLWFIQKCPQFSQQLSASNTCMLVFFSMSGFFSVDFDFKVRPWTFSTFCDIFFNLEASLSDLT